MARKKTTSRGTGRKTVRVTGQSSTGRNEKFRDGNVPMSTDEFVRRIENGEYPGYHVRVVNGEKTPASNPDGSDGNNLG